MKRFILYTCLAMAAASSFAQTTVTNNWFVRDQDLLYSATDSSATGVTVTAASNVAQAWNFSTLQASRKDTFEVFTAASGTAAAAFPTATLRISFLGGWAYAVRTGTVVKIIGYSGDLLNVGQSFNIPFSDAQEFQVAPITFGQTINNTSALRFAIKTSDYPTIDSLLSTLLPGGISADSLRINRTTKDHDVVDAFGTVQVPNNTITYDVLRSYRTAITDTKLELKIGFFGWVDASQFGTAIPGTGKDTTYSYNFMSNAERQNVATITMAKTGGIARVQYLYAPTAVATKNAIAATPNLTAAPNPASNTVRIAATELPQGSYTLRIANVLGSALYTERVSANATSYVDVSNWQNGIYVYTLSDAKGVVLAAKRLFVSHP